MIMNLDDPTEPLIDLSVHSMHGDIYYQVSVQAPQLGCPCQGVGWLGREWLEKRSPQCTCGAGDPEDFTVLHKVQCDSVPCPFCPLERTVMYAAAPTPDWAMGSRPWCVVDTGEWSPKPYSPVIYLNKQESAEKIASLLNDDEA